MARVVLENVTKVFPGGVLAVDNVSFEVEDKEFVVLVGPSGCGKSTTLRMVAGLEEVTEGKIYIGERLVNDVPPKDRDIAMVFQNYALYPHMTVYNNMAFGLKLRRFPKAEIDARVREAAQILGITDLLDRKPKALSGGQRQRVAVGRAIVRKPAVFLFDEPLSNLDAKLRVQMRAEINKLHRRLQSTMMYVTHDQVEAMTMGDRIVVLRDGRVQQIADPGTLYDKPANIFVAGFIGSPPMNFVEGTLVAENGGIVFKNEAFNIPLPPDRAAAIREARSGQGEELRDVVFGVRPEDISDRPFQERSGREVSQVSAVVEVVEPLGSEILAHLKAGDNTLTARLDPHSTVKVGETRTFYVDVTKAHLFDRETERAIF